MVKFYVVDGISYPAAEAAVGIFYMRGYECMAACREWGFANAGAKGSMELGDLLAHFTRAIPAIEHPGIMEEIPIDPLSHYLENNGFGVTASDRELALGWNCLVSGMTYRGAEDHVGLSDTRGFQAMYAVCKLGAFNCANERPSMSPRQFLERLDRLGIPRPDYLPDHP
jgi:hypothetical protein